jgi:hypothetical protein
VLWGSNIPAFLPSQVRLAWPGPTTSRCRLSLHSPSLTVLSGPLSSFCSSVASSRYPFCSARLVLLCSRIRRTSEHLPPSRTTSATPLHCEAAAMVYITSDLFGPNTTHDWQQDNATNYWPAMTNDQHAAGLGKRRRLAGDDGPQMYDDTRAFFYPSGLTLIGTSHANTGHLQDEKSTAYISTIPRPMKATTAWHTRSSLQNHMNTPRSDDRLRCRSASVRRQHSPKPHHT